MRFSELPLPSLPPSAALRVVTLGGGHGQSTLLGALRRLECAISAVVSIADDGGCSGKLREELGMPPPGDIRRCLSSLATREDLAARFEERLRGGLEDGRSVGNLVLAEMRQDVGSLQRAVDWTAALLGCVGRVIPAAEEAGTLSVYDLVHGSLRGESRIEQLSDNAVVARVEGPERASREALAAIAAADVILFGPGSFVGSTLAVLTTADVAAAVVAARARRVLIRNVRSEERTGFPGAVQFDEQERVLRDHLVIGSGGGAVRFDVLAHDPDGPGATRREDGTFEFRSPLAAANGRHHDPDRLAEALARHLGIPLRHAVAAGRALGASDEHPSGTLRSPAPLEPSPEARAIFERYLISARERLFGRA